jgi:hypothetical protein
MFNTDDFAFVDQPKEEPTVVEVKPEAVAPAPAEAGAPIVEAPVVSLDPAAEALKTYKEYLAKVAAPVEVKPEVPAIPKPEFEAVDSMDYILDPNAAAEKALNNAFLKREYENRVDQHNRAQAQSALDAALGTNSQELAQKPEFAKFLKSNPEVEDSYRKAVKALDVASTTTVLKLFQVVNAQAVTKPGVSPIPGSLAVAESGSVVASGDPLAEQFSDAAIAAMSPQEWDKNKAAVYQYLSSKAAN